MKGRNRYEVPGSDRVLEIGKLMIELMAGSDALVTRFLDEADFQEIVSEGLAREIFAAVAEPAGEPSA